MSSILPYAPATSPNSHKKPLWRWVLGITLGIGFAYVIPETANMVGMSYAQGNLIGTAFWSLGVFLLGILACGFLILGIDDSTHASFVEFFRARLNRRNSFLLVAMFIFGLLGAQVGWLALGKCSVGDSFICVNYVGGAVILACIFLALLLRWTWNWLGVKLQEIDQDASPMHWHM